MTQVSAAAADTSGVDIDLQRLLDLFDVAQPDNATESAQVEPFDPHRARPAAGTPHRPGSLAYLDTSPICDDILPTRRRRRRR